MAKSQVLVYLVVLAALYTAVTTQNKPCPGKFFNLIFVIDSSFSVGENLYPENFKFVKNFLSAFEIGDFKTKVALITFASYPRLIFNLTGNETLINQHLENIPKYQNSTTQTGRALRFVVENGLANESRPDVDTIVYLVTDGKSDNYTDTIDAARLVKSQGFAIVGIGIGGRRKNWTELQEVASRPEYFINIENYEALKNYTESISQETCNIIPPEPIPTATPEPATTTPETTTPQPCIMWYHQGMKGDDNGYTEFIPAASLYECDILCRTSSTCQATELRNGICFISNTPTPIDFDWDYSSTVIIKDCRY